MEFEIITFGNGEVLKRLFDAIVLCMNAQTGTLYTPLVRMGMIFGVLWAAIYSIYGDFLKAWGKGLLPLIFIPPLLFVPSTTLWVRDVASQYREKVDHVPFGLAYVAHFISQVGYGVTQQVDQVFADVDDLKYHKSGFLMASNLIRQARTFRITNSDMADNMRQFVGQCIVYDALLGYKYTLEDLRHSADIWALVSAHASPVRAFVWKEPHKPEEAAHRPQTITCKEGARRFNQMWGHEIDRAKGIFGIRLFGSANTAANPLKARQEFIKYLPLSYSFLSGLTRSADQILKQQMMVHTVVDGIEHKSLALGNAPSFAARRAYLQQRSAYETLGAMASETLTTMKAVLEAIAYTAFIFIVPLSVLPFGIRILLSWIQTLLWLQMWAPLYAVLNFMMGMAASSRSTSLLSTSSANGVTIASSAGLMDLNADMAAMAGFLAMSVPFLAIALVKGVGSFVHMASHLGNVPQGAASQAAGDAVSGNYSFGNISEGNQQIANTNMLSQSRAASLRAASFQSVDGRADITTLADGAQIVNIGTSNLPVSLNRTESASRQESALASQSYQNSLTHSRSSATSLSSSFKDMVSLSETLAKSESLSDGLSQGASAEQSRDLHQGVALIRKFGEQNDMDASKAAEVLASASVGGGFLLSGSITGKTSTSATDRQVYQNAIDYSSTGSFQQGMKQSAQAAHNLSHQLSDETSRRMATDIAGSYEVGMHEKAEAAKSLSEAVSHTHQAMVMDSRSSGITANYNQPFVDWLSEQRRDNTSGTLGQSGVAEIGSGDPAHLETWERKFMKEKGLLPSTGLPTSPAEVKAGYEAETRHTVYPASRDAIETLKHEGAALFNQDLSSQGALLREDTATTLAATTKSLTRQASALDQDGARVKERVQAEQGRAVTVKTLKQVGEETIATVDEGFREDTQRLAAKSTRSPAISKPPGRGMTHVLSNLEDKKTADIKKLTGDPQQK